MTGERILVVEDEPLIRLILCEELSEHGFQVVEAASGDEAARLIDSDGFRVVVTDVQMPGALDGLSVGRQALARHDTTQVIYMTGRPDRLAGLGRTSARELLMRKPFGRREMLAAIARMLPPAA